MDNMNMSVFDYVYAFETMDGTKGIVRADNEDEARERIRDCFGIPKVIVLMDDLDGDYGCISQTYIEKELENRTPVVQYSFDIIGEFDEEIIKKYLEEKLGTGVFGVVRKATWTKYGYLHGESPLYD